MAFSRRKSHLLAMLIGAGCLLIDLGAFAADLHTTEGAYEVAMKCFVAYGSISGERQDAGDAATAASYEKRARRSFDVAVSLGQRLNYSRGRMDQDFGLAQTRELPKMVANRPYLNDALATCAAAGF